MTEENPRAAQTDRLRAVAERKAEQARVRSHEHSIDADDRGQDVVDPRTKNSGHGKKTADKWNQ